MQTFLDRTFWDITLAQLAGELSLEALYRVWPLWDAYNNAHQLYSTLADSYDPAGMHRRLADTYQRITERDERMRQVPEPEPEENEPEEDEPEEDNADLPDETPVRCPRNCGDCGGLRYGCGLTLGDLRAARLAAAIREAQEEEAYEAWAQEERWRRQEQDREDYAREREEEERDEWDEWREGGGQGCGNCIDVCRCHCYDDY